MGLFVLKSILFSFSSSGLPLYPLPIIHEKSDLVRNFTDQISSIFSPSVGYKVKRQALLLKIGVPSALFSFSGPLAGEGLFMSPAAAFNSEMNY